MDNLPLYQQLYLLAHDDHGEPLTHPLSLGIGLAGAALLDLILTDRLRSTEGWLALRERRGTGDTVTDGLLATIADDRGDPSIRRWIEQAALEVQDRARGALLAAGILTATTRRRLGVLPRNRHAPSNPRLPSMVRTSLRRAVLTDSIPDPTCGALCGLIAALRLHEQLDLDLPAAFLLHHLDELLHSQVEAVVDIVITTKALIGESAVAIYR